MCDKSVQAYPLRDGDIYIPNSTADVDLQVLKMLSQPSPKSNPNSNLGLAGQHNWS